MKKKKVISIILPLIVNIAFINILVINVKATNAYYITNNGVALTEYEFGKLSSIFHISQIDNFTETEIQKYLNCDIVDAKTVYYKTISRDGIIFNETEITKDEFDNAQPNNYTCDENTRGSDSGFFETSYKSLTASILEFSDGYFFSNVLLWKIVPATRSYDVIAFRTKHMDFYNVAGEQVYYVGNNSTSINYNTNSAGYKGMSNGAGISMNLKDDTNITSFLMTQVADMQISDYNYTTAHVFATYQHAQSSLTRAQSMSYTLQAGGLGDVLYYSNTSIRNKYDDMAGIMLSIPIP